MKYLLKLKNKKGFTLVELIVVVAIIAILTAVLVPIIGNYTAQAAQTACQQNASEAKQAVNITLSSLSITGAVISDSVTCTGTASGTPTVTCTNNNLKTALQSALTGMEDGDTFSATVVNNACTTLTYTKGSITVTL